VSIQHDREARPVHDCLDSIHQLGSHGAEPLLPENLRSLIVKALHLAHTLEKVGASEEERFRVDASCPKGEAHPPVASTAAGSLHQPTI
jgi:hypothetical protein